MTAAATTQPAPSLRRVRIGLKRPLTADVPARLIRLDDQLARAVGVRAAYAFGDWPPAVQS